MARWGMVVFVRHRIASLVALVAIATLSGLPAQAGDRVALVIGNAAYSTFGTLANPVNDANDIAAVLRGIGFSVVERDNVDAHDFSQLLSDFATRAEGADVALFYYSGHGLQFQSENYLLPVDATLTNRFALTHETMALGDVTTAMSGAHAALVFVDACRSFPIAGTFFAKANERVTRVMGLAQPATEANTFIGFSAQPGQTARDGTGRNSPFTSAMLDYLPKPGLDVMTMFSDVTGEVVQATEGGQKPQSFGDMSAPLTLVASVAAPVAADGPSPEERAYGAAKDVNTIGSYRAFLARFPGGFYAELAQEQLARLVTAPPGQPSPSSSEPLAAPVSSEPLPIGSIPRASLITKTVTASGEQCDAEAGDPSDPGHVGGGAALADPAAIEVCRTAARENPTSPRFSYQLGRALLAAHRVPEAVAAFRIAVGAGYPEAMTALARAMRDGDSIKKDVTGAIKLFRQAAEKGSSNAMAMLGVLYSRGVDVARDDKQAFAWYTQAAALNQTVAINNLAAMYSEGRATAVDQVKAEALYQKGVALGDPTAMYNLGWLLDGGGKGIDRNPEAAADWLIKAIANNRNLYDQLIAGGGGLTADTRRALQQAMSDAGAYSGAIDGTFDDATRAALGKLAAKG